MTTSETVKALRNGENVRFFDKEKKCFVQFQLNKKESFICWERHGSLDKRNWVKQNEFLSIKDVLNIREKLIEQRIKG